MYEVLNKFLLKIKASNIIDKLELTKNKFFVVSAHREENISSQRNLNGLIDSLNQIAKLYNYPVILSAHPRTRNMINDKNIKTHKNIHILKPLGFLDYNCLQMNSFAVLSDSGTINEESSILNFRALNLRDAHERPEAMEEASVMMVGMNTDRIIQGLTELSRQEITENRNFREVSDYSMPNVSLKVVRFIISYVDYINQNIYKKLI